MALHCTPHVPHTPGHFSVHFTEAELGDRVGTCAGHQLGGGGRIRYLLSAVLVDTIRKWKSHTECVRPSSALVRV